ncbi:L-threonylcarbamoyladenylate synthase [Sandaracinus amylolyticus]|uniref:Threonylcarbamoyl-AMP synthase n=1 Tax=Sandaracinus amylolyticus TaxID=927083 RepID=A0A0F6W4Q5_9BACT|nr:L-threonylcarbamoyladenylate synthase [Sandaracinus amylolyticus]AKF07425.1 TsaC protein (YrdC domain) required for threonylcarbamoyladenosine t(6)A37 modification in tRNA [Sandaracinus amylolyticus]
MAPTVDVDTAATLLRAGKLVAIPTETVYGLGADAEQPDAVARIFAAKGRPSSHPLIVHLRAADALDEGWAANVPPAARRLADVLWPGPLTLILQRGPRALDAVTGGLSTVGLRVPAHPLARALLERVGGIAAPSANRFGSVSPTTAAHVQRDLGDRIDAVLDGGPCEVGIESTIVDVSTGVPRILRPGGISREVLEEILGAPVPMAGDDAPRAPGMLASHYAPRAKVVAVAPRDASQRAHELAREGRIALLAPPTLALDLPDALERIDVPADPRERARTLYESLRAIDERGFERAIVVLPDDERGLGLAIADRLRKAGAPKD